VRRGKPKNPGNYEQHEIEGITVYFKASLSDLFSNVTIKIERLLFIKSLVAIGAN
jgi:hypothetical protein